MRDSGKSDKSPWENPSAQHGKGIRACPLSKPSVQESPMATSSSQQCCPSRGNLTLLSTQHQCCHTSAIHLQASQILLCGAVPT